MIITDEDKPSNVLVFPSVKEIRESGGPVSRNRTPKPNPCQHRKHGYLVDAEAREVTCKNCDAVMDPITAISELARYWDWEETRRAKKSAEAEAEKILKDLDRLKRQRANARKSGYISVASVRLAFADMAKRFRANAHTTASGSDVCSSAARLVEATRDKLLNGESEEPTP